MSTSSQSSDESLIVTLSDVENKPFPTLIEERARNTPDRVYASIPKSDDLRDGYTNFTYKQFAKAVDAMSWWLTSTLGASINLDTIAYIGANDLRYVILYIAAIKTNRKVLAPLSMNARQSLLNLLSSTNCHVLIASLDSLSLWHALTREGNEQNFTIITIPPLTDFTSVVQGTPYRFEKTWDDIKDNAVWISQTSGSTGQPKPIQYTHHMFSTWAWIFPDQRADISVLVTYPPSWLLGLCLTIHYPLMFGTIPVFLPAGTPQPLNAEYIDRIHAIVKIRAGVYIPAVLNGLAQSQRYTSRMTGLRWIGFAGAPLDTQTGDTLARYFNLRPIMGATEVGPVPLRPSKENEWMYYNFGLNHRMGFHWIPYQGDLYESVIVRHTDTEMVGTQVIFHVYPDLDVYHTKDLWREHPTKRGQWQMCGRTDDFVKLASLTKFNAIDVEKIVVESPIVEAAIMGGDNRKIPFLLVELTNPEMEDKEALCSLWPLIEKTNQDNSSEIRLNQEMIMFSKKEKPFKKVMGKQTVNRRATIEEYAEEIEVLYEENAELTNDSAS